MLTRNDMEIDLEKVDVKDFWKGIKSIISPKDDSNNHVDKSEWVNHFSSVLNAPAARGNDRQFLDYIETSLPILENHTIINESLNRDISCDEIRLAIKDLKNGKSIYTDNIGNEAL